MFESAAFRIDPTPSKRFTAAGAPDVFCVFVPLLKMKDFLTP